MDLMRTRRFAMTDILKANDNKSRHDVSLPLPPLELNGGSDHEIYARFMRHIRLVPNSRIEIKVLSAIQFTADMLDSSDAIIAKTLADMGLRAPRRAFPESYLEYVDRSLMRSGFEVGGPCASTLEMKAHWDGIGEDKFAGFKRDYAVLSEPLQV